MAAIAQQPGWQDVESAQRGRTPERQPRLRGEGIHIEATRAAVYDVLVDRTARPRWLGSPGVIEDASLTMYGPRVRLALDRWPGPDDDHPSAPHVTIRTRRPDGAVVSLRFLLHAEPLATIVEVQHQLVYPSNPRHRPAAGWRAAHWRRRCLEALRREVLARNPTDLKVRRRRRATAAPRTR